MRRATDLNTGIPGTGLATIFYVLSVLIMPPYELIRMACGLGTSMQRWRRIMRHTLVSTAMFAMFYGTFSYLPTVRLGSRLIESQYLAIAVPVGLLLIIVILLPHLRPIRLRAGHDVRRLAQ
jgi:uncharacterized membrane protein